MSGWKHVLSLLVLIVLGCCCSIAADITLDLSAEGWVDALVAGLEITADIGGFAWLQGELGFASACTSFTAEGAIYGFGVRNLLALVTEGWILLDAEGVQSDGEPLAVQSLIHTRTQGLVALQVGEIIEVSHYTQIETEGQRLVAAGLASGVVLGGVVPSGKAMTIRLEGDGTFDFTGTWLPDQDALCVWDVIPLEHSEFPPDLYRTIERIFNL